MKTLVAGIGNIFNRDDGFGVHVAQQLAVRPWPEDVRVEDYGVRSVHLALELLDGYDLVVLVDAVPGDGPPGTLVVEEPEGDPRPTEPVRAPRTDPHAVLGMVADLGGKIGRVLVVGCHPASVDEGIGLTHAVADAISPAVHLVERLIFERNAPCSVAY